MYSYFFPPAKAKKDGDKEQIVLSDFRIKLKEKVLNEYINLPFYTKALLGIGVDGLQIAKDYVKDFELDWPPDIILFEDLLSDVRSPMGHGKLKNSKVLRAILAEGLCEHVGISAEHIAAQAKYNAAKNPFSSTRYEIYKVDAALSLLDQLRSSKDLLGPPKRRY